MNRLALITGTSAAFIPQIALAQISAAPATGGSQHEQSEDIIITASYVSSTCLLAHLF